MANDTIYVEEVGPWKLDSLLGVCEFVERDVVRCYSAGLVKLYHILLK